MGLGQGSCLPQTCMWPACCRCVTFGSPKVGNATLGKAVSCLVGSSVRVVNGRDPLPALPSALA